MARPLRSSAAAEGGISQWREVTAGARVAAVVEALWIGTGGWPHRFRLLPDGAVDIVWDGERLTAVALSDFAVTARVRRAALNVGVRLRCGCAGSILGAPPRVGRSDLATTWGRLGQDSVRRLRQARDPDVALQVLEGLVEERLHAGRGLDPLVMTAADRLQAHQDLAVEDLAPSLGADARGLRRRFSAQVGLSPKRLQRVFRLQAMLREVATAASAADLAAALGFADQAHMVRECRAMTGSTPGALARALAA